MRNRRINVKGKVALHNKHYIVLKDAKTGKVKQKGYAYNMVLNAGLSRLVGQHFPSGNHGGYRFFGTSITPGLYTGMAGHTFIGSDDTAVQPTDTALGSIITYKTNNSHGREIDMGNLTASHTRKVVWDETEIQGTTIKEVGLGVMYNSTQYLFSRAVIEDSEGNPISIVKGTNDILTVLSTVYIKLDHNYGSNMKFVEGSVGNALLNWIYCNMTINGTDLFTIGVGKNNDEPLSTDNYVKTPVATSIILKSDADFFQDTTNYKIKIESLGTGGNARFGASEGNDVEGIWEIGARMRLDTNYAEFNPGGSSSDLFRAVLPLPGVWSGTTITDEELGTGDGTTTLFQTAWAPVLTGTDIVKVDGVSQARGTDYTIDLATGEITFAAAPGTGLAITGTYGIEQIPKDSNHVLDIGFTIQFADGSV